MRLDTNMIQISADGTIILFNIIQKPLHIVIVGAGNILRAELVKMGMADFVFGYQVLPAYTGRHHQEVCSMKCPFCAHPESKVVDSRPADEGASIRRRRECLSCHKRFTTYETMESLPLMVIKKDGSRQSFDRNKVMAGLIRACEKRPVSYNAMEAMVNEIEQVLQNQMEREVSSAEIGELVMERLKKTDEVAYVRFASVYRQFKDINTFMNELSKLLEDK